MGSKSNLLLVQKVVASGNHVDLSGCTVHSPKLDIRRLAFHLHSFTNSVTLGKSLNLAEPNFFT